MQSVLVFLQGVVLLWVAFIVIALLILRPLILWLFMIRRRTLALESIAESLELMPAVQQYRQAQRRAARAGRP